MRVAGFSLPRWPRTLPSRPERQVFPRAWTAGFSGRESQIFGHCGRWRAGPTTAAVDEQPAVGRAQRRERHLINTESGRIRPIADTAICEERALNAECVRSLRAVLNEYTYIVRVTINRCCATNRITVATRNSPLIGKDLLEGRLFMPVQVADPPIRPLALRTDFGGPADWQSAFAHMRERRSRIVIRVTCAVITA